MSPAHEALEKLFHEPSRLAIMSELCACAEGLPFPVLKQRCALSDGNLSRHLSTLEKAGAVQVEKSFVGVKPRTTACVTKEGRRSFLDYLDALSAVLQEASARARPAANEKKSAVPGAKFKPARGY